MVGHTLLVVQAKLIHQELGKPWVGLNIPAVKDLAIRLDALANSQPLGLQLVNLGEPCFKLLKRLCVAG